MASTNGNRATVTGPGIEEYVSPGGPVVALSAAQGFAVRADEPATFYVRDGDGEVVYHVERDTGGTVFTRERRRP